MSEEKPTPDHGFACAQRLARQFSSQPQVEAVALSGSRTSIFADQHSDVDLYVYVTEDIPLHVRADVARGSPRAEIGNATWEPGDEWIDADTGIRVDIMYRHLPWIQGQLDRVLRDHQASVGYSTCFWYNVRSSQVLFDRRGWFARLQQQASQPYPAQLKAAILAKNWPLLRHNQSSYRRQIELAIRRDDPVSVHHRVTALLASYFDVLFAVNELPHPGEKRLLQHAMSHCSKAPRGMQQSVTELLSGQGGPNSETIARLNQLIDGLDDLLRQERSLPSID